MSLLVACSSSRGDGGYGQGGGISDRDAEVSDASDAAGHSAAGSAGDGSGGSGGSAADGGTVADDAGVCGTSSCGPGQRCDLSGAGAHCVDLACADLSCAANERCEEHAQGGHLCVDVSCEGDVDCPSDEHCASGVCAADSCEAAARSCSGQRVLECSSNGAKLDERFSCGTGSYFTSACLQAAPGQATCSCQDDWDCPAFTTCEAGRCAGTGQAPTCSLPPVPFEATLPVAELHWGGDSVAAADAHDGTAARNPAPWPSFSHVVNTPVVANLDDDNGDGLIDELDFPEIIFISHKGDNAAKNGVLRAIHGGGPDKGADYFARCGTKLWTRANPTTDSCADSDPDGDSGAPVAVADLDNDGVPEIVYVTEGRKFRILDNHGGLLYTLSQAWESTGKTESDENATIAVANLDFKDYAEIIVGRSVYVLGKDENNALTVTHILSGTKSYGSNVMSRMACPADIIPERPGQEIAVGATLYALPAAGLPAWPACSCPSGCATPAPCTGALDEVWYAPAVSGNSGKLTGEGFCAVADVWGADTTQAPGPNNRPDTKPEVILIDDGDLSILDGQTGKVILDRKLNGGSRGGAPNVDDFDGDGFMEVASALSDFYTVEDLQDSTGSAGSCPQWPTVIPRDKSAANPNPARTPGGSCDKDSDCDAAAVCNRSIGSCVCLHNGWKRDSDDDSSKATSSSVFDFNGDGAAEVLYNDECDFRIYDGRSGGLLFTAISRSRTLIENPVVADVDNDGNAEVVTGMNTAMNDRCDDDYVGGQPGTPQGPNGLRVWGDPTDTWVAARRIWNQQSYHVTNVLESGAIPAHAVESWKSWGGRVYDTYRSQPRSYGVAPDLTVAAVGVSSPDAACGSLSDNVDIAFEIANAGDLRVGPGVKVRFFGTWGATEEALLNAGTALETVLQQSLEPGHSVLLTVHFKASDNHHDQLPSQVRVVVDPTGSGMPDGAERECHEDNNSRSAKVDPGDMRADLSIELGAVVAQCPTGTVETTVHNRGTAPAEHVVVRYYAGDPAQGGTVLHEEMLPERLAAGADVTFTAMLESIPSRGAITLFALVDPDRAVDECDEANNRASAPTDVQCADFLQ